MPNPSTFGHSKLAEKMVQKFGADSGTKIQVDMRTTKKIREFAATVENAKKKAKKSKLLFR